MAVTVSSLALICFALLGAGYVLFFLLGRNARMAPTVRDAWPVLLAETLIVCVAAGAFWFGGPVLTVALLLLTARVGYEAATVANLRCHTVPPLLFGGALAGAALLAGFLPLVAVASGALIALLAGFAVLASGRISADTHRGVLLDLLLFPTLPLVVFTASGLSGGFGVWLLAAFILAETFDSYALLGGRLFGRHKAFPALSPHKTIEGLVIGAVMLMLTTALVGALLAGLPLTFSAALALLAGALSVTGDLAASRLKRRSGVKDYPPVLPHQGGLFDITDAWIATGAGFCTLAILFDLA